MLVGPPCRPATCEAEDEVGRWGGIRVMGWEEKGGGATVCVRGADV